MRTPFIVQIMEIVPTWRRCFKPTYEIEVMGFGAPTMAEAATRAAACMRRLAESLRCIGPNRFERKRFRARFTLPCDPCLRRFRTAKRRKKACPSCGGTGVIDGWSQEGFAKGVLE